MDTSTNLILAWPWALSLWALPALLKRLLERLGLAMPSQAALQLPLAVTPTPSDQSHWSGRFLNPWYGVWLLLVLAVARPELQQPEVEWQESTRQLMLVVDVSGSMREMMDGRTRLDHVKQVVEDFVQQRRQDRLGLIVFGGQAHLYVPLTQDHQLLLHQLQGMQPNMAGPGTAIGDALGVSINALRELEGEPAILLLTDGENNAGVLQPQEALAMAASAGIRTHLVVFALNPEPEVAAATRQTGGEVFSAFNRRELEGVYQQLDDLEPSSVTRRLSPSQPLGFWLVLAALVWSGWLLRARILRRHYV